MAARGAGESLAREMRRVDIAIGLGQPWGEALAQAAGSPTPMFDAACTLWDAALAMGLGDEDPTAAIKVLEARAGVEVRGSGAPG